MSLFDINSLLDSHSAPADAGAEPFFERKRKAWHAVQQDESRCDFAEHRHSLSPRGCWLVSLWKKSAYGPRLSEIKAERANRQRFADGLVPFISGLLGDRLGDGGWCIVTPPPRRHRADNFAQAVARLMSDRLGIKFYPDVSVCHSNSNRINEEFELVELPEEPNIIVFDDIITTGSTLMSMDRMLRPHGKNLFFVTGINNH